MYHKQPLTHPALVIRIARGLGILFAIFLSIFALDVFEAGLPLGQILLALLMHLAPMLIVLIILWIAWKHPLPGGILFCLAGAGYILEASGQVFSTYLLIAGIPILTGFLFLWGYFSGSRSKT